MCAQCPMCNAFSTLLNKDLDGEFNSKLKRNNKIQTNNIQIAVHESIHKRWQLRYAF